MSQTATIEKACTVTIKGQTTLPLAVRQVLGVPDGGKIMVRVEGRQVTLSPSVEEHDDPAIGAFLALLANDIAGGRNISPIDGELAEVLRDALHAVDVDPEEAIAGETCL